jgi:hypothetical protein
MRKLKDPAAPKKALKVSPVLEKIQQQSRDALYQSNRTKKHCRQLARNSKRTVKKKQMAQSSAMPVLFEEGQLIAAASEGFQQPPQCSKTSVDAVPFLTLEHRLEPGLQLHYSAKELKDLYGWDKAPTIPAQNKAGGQCAFQAHTSLMWSICSIGPTHQFGQVPFIKSKMVASVNSINKQMLDGDIPTDRWNSQHLYAGDDKLHEFSVHAFLHFGGCLNPYRYSTMRNKGGACLGLHWLLKQSSGYFIVYGNRHDLEDEGKKKFLESFHFLAVNVEKQIVIDNKTSKGFLRLCKEAFTDRMKTIHTILRFEKLEGRFWKVVF